jgi:hypothetical protein
MSVSFFMITISSVLFSMVFPMISYSQQKKSMIILYNQRNSYMALAAHANGDYNYIWNWYSWMSIIVVRVHFLGSWVLYTRGFIIGTKYKNKCYNMDIVYFVGHYIPWFNLCKANQKKALIYSFCCISHILYFLLFVFHLISVYFFLVKRFGNCIFVNHRGSSTLPGILGSLYSWFHNWHKIQKQML